ncbi:MAG: MBL fold metallo-hydrolase [Candidatus ainarchaeum sp.]|nr:MBL fold metallo-hydrolase [Candidatus ainarchaeum sp.]
MIKQKNGINFRNLCIDPTRSPTDKNVIFTHAHADHVKFSDKSNFFATPPTIDLIKKRFFRKKTKFNEINFFSKKTFDDFELELYPNGHILGSSQLKIFNNKEIVVTSDFRLQDSLFFKGAIPLPSETLVLETTFGSPIYKFPKYFDVVSEMVSWISKEAKNNLVLLSGYSLGKAQELTKISNEAGFTPLVYESIFEMNKIYSSNNINLGDYELLDHNLKDFSVLIMPPQLVNKFLLSTLKEFDSRKIVSALATGWSFARGYDKLFPLSNHADFNDLVSYVEQSNPKIVLTDHGFCEEFSRKLNRLGYNSKPLKNHKQQVLFDF